MWAWTWHSQGMWDASPVEWILSSLLLGLQQPPELLLHMFAESFLPFHLLSQHFYFYRAVSIPLYPQMLYAFPTLLSTREWPSGRKNLGFKNICPVGTLQFGLQIPSSSYAHKFFFCFLCCSCYKSGKQVKWTHKSYRIGWHKILVQNR